MKRRPSEELLSEAEPATEDGKGRSESLPLVWFCYSSPVSSHIQFSVQQ